MKLTKFCMWYNKDIDLQLKLKFYPNYAAISSQRVKLPNSRQDNDAQRLGYTKENQRSLAWSLIEPDEIPLHSLYCGCSCNQAALWMVQSVRPSVNLSARHTIFIMFRSLYHHEIFTHYYPWRKRCACKRSRSEDKGQGHRGQNKFCPNLGISEL